MHNQSPCHRSHKPRTNITYIFAACIRRRKTLACLYTFFFLISFPITYDKNNNKNGADVFSRYACAQYDAYSSSHQTENIHICMYICIYGWEYIRTQVWVKTAWMTWRFEVVVVVVVMVGEYAVGRIAYTRAVLCLYKRKTVQMIHRNQQHQFVYICVCVHILLKYECIIYDL